MFDSESKPLHEISPAPLRLHLAELPAPVNDPRREEAICRLLVAVELIGTGPVAALLEDLERYGIAEERRWLENILACRREHV